MVCWFLGVCVVRGAFFTVYVGDERARTGLSIEVFALHYPGKETTSKRVSNSRPVK